MILPMANSTSRSHQHLFQHGQPDDDFNLSVTYHDSMSRIIHALYIGTVFLGAMLGFQIQPLISSALLPWFGGSPAVWTVCLLFFQTALFAGYYYAFRLIRLVTVRGQALIHSGLLCAALLVPVLPGTSWKPHGDENPNLKILWLLASHTGLPFLALSATGPLLQVWFLRLFPGKSPYRLYAFSNAGSFLGLISVPFFLQVWFSLPQQATIWYGCLSTFCVLMMACAATAVFSERKVAKEERVAKQRFRAPKSAISHQSSQPARIQRLWFLLAMVPTVLLAAITNKLTTDVSPVPFLWVAPLTIYLASLVVCFSNEHWAARRFWLPVMSALLLASAVLISLKESSWVLASLPLQFGIHFGTLMAACMVCHGELVRLKPIVSDGSELDDMQLTSFYLVMALGGAAGGFFTAVVAPLVFPFYLEYHVGLLASALLPAVIIWPHVRSKLRDAHRATMRVTVVTGIVALTSLLIFDVVQTLRSSYLISRSFFGVIRVVEYRPTGSPIATAYMEFHGTTMHGFQSANQELAKVPTTYFNPTSGIGIALTNHHQDQTRRVGIVGLGVGTLAAYGRAGDVVDFYEIDPVVRDLAQNFFRYLGDCKAAVNVVSGDARLSLEALPGHNPYDVLVLDAFSSDAIPAHLLTAEAFDIYRQHLADDAIVAVNISSRHFDLRPVLAGHARRLNWSVLCVHNFAMAATVASSPSYWVLMSPHEESLSIPKLAELKRVPMDETIDWTDARHSPFGILRQLPQ